MIRTQNVHNAISFLLQQVAGQWSVVENRLKQGGDEWVKAEDMRKTMGRILGLLEIAILLEPENEDFRRMISEATDHYATNVVYMRGLQQPVAPTEKLPKVTGTTVTVTIH